VLEDLGGGIWRWELRHPEWHPRTEFGATVACFAAHHGGGTVLIDPLLDDAVTPELDALIRGEVAIAITLPYHVRSAAAAAQRWNGVICGHPDLAKRLPPGTAVEQELPLGLKMHPLSRGKERPLELPELKALAFGDRFVGAQGGVRYWMSNPITDARRAWFRKTGAPSFAHLLEIDFDKVLLTHGPPVLHDGHAAVQDALNGEPWYHRPT
jgi:hypothetical protein